MLVALVDPTEVGVVDISAGPVEAVDAIARIFGGLKSGILDPGMGFGVAVGEADRARIAVKNGEWVHPAWRRLHIDDPRPSIEISGVGLFDEYHRFGGRGDFRHFFEWNDAPTAAIHPVRFRIAVVGPTGTWGQPLRSEVARAVIGIRVVGVFVNETIFQAGLHRALSLFPRESTEVGNGRSGFIHGSPPKASGGIPIPVDHFVLVIVRVHHEREGDLFLVVQTRGSGGAEFGAVQCGKQHARQDRDNGDHDKQLDERKSVPPPQLALFNFSHADKVVVRS